MNDTGALAARRFRSSRRAAEEFFGVHAERVARACLEMARRFDRGGRLLAVGERAAASDAQHVAVEFVHPVLVGKRALPALAFTQPLDAGERGWVDRIRSVARSCDIVLAISHHAMSTAMSRAVEDARRRGMLTFVLSGGPGIEDTQGDFTFHVPCDDALVVQEVQETLYHVFWELVHVFLREPHGAAGYPAAACAPDASGHCSVCGDDAQPAVVVAMDDGSRSAVVAMNGMERAVAMDLVERVAVGDTVMVHQGFAITALTAPASDPQRALYPFLYHDEPRGRSTDAALDEVRVSTLAKCGDVVELREQILREYADAMPECAAAMVARFARGGKLITFGNGGSATDAEDAAADCRHVARDDWHPLPALALTADTAVMSAIANDVGFDNVFARQVIAFGEEQDIALGISTSGNSPNVIAGLREAQRRRLLTIALAGADGGEMASGVADFCFIARTVHVPRIQEGQATVWHALLELVQAAGTAGAPR